MLFGKVYYLGLSKIIANTVGISASVGVDYIPGEQVGL